MAADGELHDNAVCQHFCIVNRLTTTVAVWVQLLSILCQTGLSRHLSFLTSGPSDAQS